MNDQDVLELPEVQHLHPHGDEMDEIEEVSSTRSLVRLLAMAATVLLISFLVVNRSTDALTGRYGTGGRFQAGSVSLIDDDTDQSLFDVPAMAPGQQYENCITVTYSGQLGDPAVQVAAKADGALASALRFTLEVGQGGSFEDCAEFAPEGVIYEGTLGAFTEHHPAGAGLTAFEPEGPGDERTFRFRFQLDADNAAQGAQAGVDFLWSVASR
jgi:hypothetical protein